MPTLPHHWELYAKQLVSFDFGHAVWEPDPKGSASVEVGDVGYFDRGRFHRLLNFLMESGDDGQGDCVPPFHRPMASLEECTDEISDISARTYESSHLVKTEFNLQLSSPLNGVPSGAVSYRSESEDAAALVLIYPAHRRKAKRPDMFDKHILANYDAWLGYFQSTTVYNSVKAEDLVFVTGRALTRQWAAAVFLRSERQARITAGAEVPGVASARFEVGRGWKDTKWMVEKEGPTLPPTGEVHDQCVFVSTVRLKFRPLVAPKVIRAAAGPDHLGSGDRDDPDCILMPTQVGRESEDEEMEVRPDYASSIVFHDGEDEEVDDRSNDVNLLTPVLDYILKDPRVEVAIAHDEELTSFLQVCQYVLSNRPDSVRSARPSLLMHGRRQSLSRTVSAGSLHKIPSHRRKAKGHPLNHVRCPLDTKISASRQPQTPDFSLRQQGHLR
ncbi:hypothetical protein JAAARDRAFT_63879 [Jaapia argillacea MUCL 33604]|uniref:Uncharacterized protein n=1 Tax=Jaapia argillacea MUCL 33604 TaxID=933084 RepID=A0A067P592_9AGAM|nr:hypothetical protein JAAARDRAFT_63879 [Jaapia argillacea MUCL 33604]